MRTIRCFARGHDGAWEAFSADFDIAVQGASFDEARRELELAIADYFEAARAEDSVTCARLLNRRAPWHVRVFWYVTSVVWGLMNRSGRVEPALFPVACPT